MNNFYDQLQNTQFVNALRGSSVSGDDAVNRANEYAKCFSRQAETMGLMGMAQNNILQKTFSGYTETPLLSTQYFNASVASFVSSFAGFMSIERDFEQPGGIFYWLDVLGVTDYRAVIPNLGTDNLDGLNTMGTFESSQQQTANTPTYSILIGRKIIPGTVRITVKYGNNSYELVDNAQGNFMAVSNVVSSATIKYLNGKIDITFADPSQVQDGEIKIKGKEDVTGTPSNTAGASNAHQHDKRFIAKMQQLGLQTVPDMLVAEYNIASLGALKKATNCDMATFLFSKLREIYTKAINKKLVDQLQNGYVEDPNVLDFTIDCSQFGPSNNGQLFYDYRSRLDYFDNNLIDVENRLATKAVKGIKTTAYVASNTASNYFQKGATIGKFEKNTKSTYINDLLGWYDGIPVLRSTDVNDDPGNKPVFYAIHKTEDGQMAPLARGIYMPLTDTPTIGNYNNPTQMASGIYYQEGVRTMANELVEKVTINI